MPEEVQSGDRVRIRDDAPMMSIDEETQLCGYITTAVTTPNGSDGLAVQTEDLDLDGCEPGHWCIDEEAVAEILEPEVGRIDVGDFVRIHPSPLRTNATTIFGNEGNAEMLRGQVVRVREISGAAVTLEASHLDSGLHNNWRAQLTVIWGLVVNFDSAYNGGQNMPSEQSRPQRRGNLISGYHEDRADQLFGFGLADVTADGDEFYFGVEMEYECRGNHRDAANEIFDDLDSWAFMSGDGSLNGGFEIITQPTSQQALEDGFNTLFSKRLTSNIGLVVNNHTGLHVNVSKSAFNSDLSKAYAIMICNNFSDFTDRIAGRSGGQWCGKQSKSLSESQHDIHGNEKYSAIHVKRHVMEIRMFKATTHPRTFQQRMDLARLIVEYSNDCASRSVLPSIDGIQEFVLNNEQFASLREFVEDEHATNESTERPITQALQYNLRTRSRRGMLSWEDEDVPSWATALLESDAGTRVFASAYRDRAMAWPSMWESNPNSQFNIRIGTWHLLSYRNRAESNQQSHYHELTPAQRRERGVISWEDPDVPGWATQIRGASGRSERVFMDDDQHIGWPCRAHGPSEIFVPVSMAWDLLVSERPSAHEVASNANYESSNT